LKSYVFQVSVTPDVFENGNPAFHASCPALKGCHSWGHTYAEALANIREAIELYVDDLIESGEPIPTGPEYGVSEYATPAIAVNL
jgi:predicted RNase H-like HicB family nuclease